MVIPHYRHPVVKNLFRCVIMGPPGSGKGTVSERLVRHFPILHLPCGDFLRREIKLKTPRGLEAKRFIDEGHLVPDKLVGDVIVAELDKVKPLNLLLDGYPRTVAQAKLLQEHVHLDAILELDVPFEVIIDRLKDRWIHQPSGRIYNLHFNPPKVAGKDDITGEELVQRDDDKESTVRQRLENYKHWEEPVAEYFKEQKLLMRFSGNATNEIWPHILRYMKSHLPEKDHHAHAVHLRP